MIARIQFSLATILILAGICACDGGRGGSSGLDISGENAAIKHAIENEQCVAFYGLQICRADPPSVETPTPGSSSSPTPGGSFSPTPTNGESVQTSLGNQTSVDCVQSTSGGPCTFTFTFVAHAFPPETAFRVLGRAGAPNDAWLLGADPIAVDASGETFDANVTVASSSGGAPAEIQFAILAFDTQPPSTPMQFTLLQQTNAASAFVTAILSVNVIVEDGNPDRPTITPTNTATSTITPTPTTPPFGPRVVGSGTADSCTEAALEAALAYGGSITFDCGPDPVTFMNPTNSEITHDVVFPTDIDGGNLVTISAGPFASAQIFYVHPGVTLHLSNVIVSTGNAFNAIYNQGGSVSVTNATFTGSTNGIGSAIYNTRLGDAVGSVTIADSTFADNSSEVGSPVYNLNGTVTVTDSTFTRNSSKQWGAIYNGGMLTVTNSTFTDNSSANGGTIYNRGSLAMTNCTVADNSSGVGALYGGGSVTLQNTIMADNAGGNCGGLPGAPDLPARITDGGHNLRWPSTDASCVGTYGDPQLAPLVGNGGPTQTRALGAGSAAIDAGDPAICAAAPVNALDQRGFVRPAPGQAACSIGAYEYNSGPA
jgi:hypothetical protein